MAYENLMVFTGNANPLLAHNVVRRLNIPIGHATVGRFSDGEVMVEVLENVRGKDCFVLQSTCTPTNDNLMEVLIMVDALKRASAGRVTAAIPYFGYGRQDRRPRSARVAISAKVVANMLEAVGVDRVLTMDLHADQIQGFFDGPVDRLMALPILAQHVKARYGGEELTVVSPDAGRIRVAERWAARLGGVPLAFIHKTRQPGRPNESVANRVVGDVRDRLCVLVDDMIDTGGTIVKAADALMGDGASGVVIAATHAILSDPAVDRLKNSPAKEVVVTNTLPLTDEQVFDKLTVLSIAPLVSRAIREVFEDGSVTSMFEGHA